MSDFIQTIKNLGWWKSAVLAYLVFTIITIIVFMILIHVAYGDEDDTDNYSETTTNYANVGGGALITLGMLLFGTAYMNKNFWEKRVDEYVKYRTIEAKRDEEFLQKHPVKIETDEKAANVQQAPQAPSEEAQQAQQASPETPKQVDLASEEKDSSSEEKVNELREADESQEKNDSKEDKKSYYW